MTVFGIFDLFFFSIIILFKNSEDYIALFSQSLNQKIVSIYQRRILNDEGLLESNSIIEAQVKEIKKARINSRRQSKADMSRASSYASQKTAKSAKS